MKQTNTGKKLTFELSFDNFNRFLWPMELVDVEEEIYELGRWCFPLESISLSDATEVAESSDNDDKNDPPSLVSSRYGRLRDLAY